MSEPKSASSRLLSAHNSGLPLELLFASLLLYLCALLATLFVSFPDLNAAIGIGRGEHFVFFDLLNFSTAFRVFAQGLSPYVPGVQNELFDQAIAGHYQHPLNCLYPPFTLVVFGPLLALPFSLLSKLWLLLSVLASVALGLLAARGVAQRAKRFLIILVCATFAPVLQSLYWGQLTVFLTLFLALALVSRRSRSPLFEGFFFALAACKPQVWFLGLITVFVFALRQRAYRSIFSFLGFLLLLSSLAELWVPGIHFSWLENLQGVGKHARLSLTPTLASVLQLWSAGRHPGQESNLPVLLLGVSSLVFLSVLIVRKNTSFESAFAWALLLSTSVSPYSWFQDQSVLLLALLLLEVKPDARECPGLRWSFLILLAVFSMLTTLAAQYFGIAQHQLYWFPLGCICLHLFKIKRN